MMREVDLATAMKLAEVGFLVVSATCPTKMSPELARACRASRTTDDCIECHLAHLPRDGFANELDRTNQQVPQAAAECTKERVTDG